MRYFSMVRAALPGPVPVLIVAALNGPTINFSGPVRIDILASCKPANYGFTGPQKSSVSAAVNSGLYGSAQTKKSGALFPAIRFILAFFELVHIYRFFIFPE